MPARAFKAAAAKYVFDYDREVAAFYRDHPERQKTLFFLDAAPETPTLYRGDAGDEDEVAEMLAQNADLGFSVATVKKNGSGMSVRYRAAGYDCVILKTPFSAPIVNPLGAFAPAAVVEAFFFDHETGHAICPGASSGGVTLEKENIADAYAVIRHIQRFGADAPLVKHLPAMRAVEMILSKTCDHFTLPVAEKILADAQRVDFAALSPAQTVARAVAYAKENTVPPLLVSFMADAFYALRLTVNDLLNNDFTAVKDLGNLLLKTDLPEQYKWGAEIFNAVLEGNISVEGERLPKPVGAEWEALRKAVKARADGFGKPPSSGLIIVPKL